MKKQILILLTAGLFAALFTDANAQNSRIGIKGGATSYQTTTEFGGIESTSDSKIGFTAGLFAEFALSNIISIQPEVLYVQKGGEDNDEDFGDSAMTLSYVDVPLLLKLNVPLEGSVKPYAIGGPYVGYLIDATDDFEGESEDIKDFFEDLNYGVMFGAGVNIGSFHIDIRYDMGLANIYAGNEEFDEFFGEGNFVVDFSGLMLTAGISF